MKNQLGAGHQSLIEPRSLNCHNSVSSFINFETITVAQVLDLFCEQACATNESDAEVIIFIHFDEVAVTLGPFLKPMAYCLLNYNTS